MTSSGLKTTIAQHISAFVQRHVPKRTKRLVLVMSLSARMKNTDTFDNETLSKLNQVMALSHTESAMKLPVQLSKAIWNGKSAVEIFNADHYKEPAAHSPDRIGEMVANAFKSMPAWLRYSEKEAKEDITALLRNSTAVLGV